MLSNTATPVHYEAFRAKVLAGEIPVCEEISLEMLRIDELIANPNVWYDPEAIDGFVEFVEDELTLTDGADVHMMDSFKLWAEQLLAWFIFVERTVWDPEEKRMVKKTIKKRLRDMQYLIVARGSAKSMYVSFLQAYFLTVDPATTQQITVAPTMVQAQEVLTPITTAIQRAKGPYFKLLTDGSVRNTSGARAARQNLASTKKGIEFFNTNSSLEIRAMSVDKCQGLRSKYNSVDEWLSGDTREDVITALMQGARKFEDPVLVAISSEGTVRNGVGDSIKMELSAILRRDNPENPQWNVSIFHYKLDSVQEVRDPSKWLKANPNLGITVSWDTYHADVLRAEQFPSQRNEILAKRFGLPMEGLTYYFTYQETLVTHAPVRHDRFKGRPCALGIDLSRGDDFCAFTWLFPLPYERFGIKTRSYITRRTFDLLQPAQRVKYEEFLAEGSLIIFEGTTLNMMQVYDDVYNHIMTMEYEVRTVGYDVYNADAFIARYISDFGPYCIEKVAQGARTESVPLGEMKHLANARRIIFDEMIMQFTMGHAVVWEDTNGNRKLMKRRHDEKIDNVSAWMDAHVAYQANPEQFD